MCAAQYGRDDVSVGVEAHCVTEYQNLKRILYWMWAIFILLLVHYITIKTAHKAFCIRWMCTLITYSQIASFEAHNILLLHLLKLINWNRRQKKKHAHTRTKTQIILSCCTSNGNNKFQPIDTNDVICLQYIHPIGLAWLDLASLIIINLFGPLNSIIPLFDSSCPFDDSNLYSPKMLIIIYRFLELIVAVICHFN